MTEKENNTDKELKKMVYFCMVLSFYNFVLIISLLFGFFLGNNIFGLISFVLITSWGIAYWRQWSKRIKPLI